MVHNESPGFHSVLFLVENATGRWGPVSNLLPLNSFIELTKFIMKAVASVLSCIRKD